MCRIAVALALFLLGIYAVAPVGTDLLQPPIYHSHKANDGGNLKQRSIIGGLLKRQYYCDPGYGYCSNNGHCCPLGDPCCNAGDCCPSGSYCSSPGHCCYGNQYICEGIYCCDKSQQCCRDGGCCDAGSYCAVGSDGNIGCCPNGKICSGASSTMTSKTTAPTNTPQTVDSNNTPQTVASTNTSETVASSNTTFSNSTSKTPSAQPGFTNIIIFADNPQITRSAGWMFGNSSCDPAQVSMKTNITDQWLTFITAANASASIYIDISTDQTSLKMFVDGEIINASHSSSENFWIFVKQ